MDIWQSDKLAMFLLFVVPGFISIKCYQLAFPGTVRATSEQLIDAVAYSSINYALLFVPFMLVKKLALASSYPLVYYLFYFFAIFVAPILWVLIWKLMRASSFMQRTAPHPTAKPWDFVFQKRKWYWVKVTLANGTVIGGRYAGNSFASSAPAPEQMYLEECWVLGEKGQFFRKKNQTAGVLILSKEISHIELRE